MVAGAAVGVLAGVVAGVFVVGNGVDEVKGVVDATEDMFSN